MKVETGIRFGLPVALLFAIAFGLILTRHSSPYEVSPPTDSLQQKDTTQNAEGSIPDSFSEPTAREWQQQLSLEQRQVERAEAADREPASAIESSEPPPPPILPPPRREVHQAEPPEPSPVPEAESPPPKRVTPVIPKVAPPAPERPAGPGERRDADTRTARQVLPAHPDLVPSEGPFGPARPTVYVIQRNDNLTKVCRKVYGKADRRLVQAVYEANRDRLRSRNHVMVGQQLRIPPLPGTTVPTTRIRVVPQESNVREADPPRTIRLPAQALERRSSREQSQQTTKRSSERSPRYQWYRVQRNESLSIIAKKKLGNGRRWNEIWKLNKGRIRKPNRLPAGVRIKIPVVGRSL